METDSGGHMTEKSEMSSANRKHCIGIAGGVVAWILILIGCSFLLMHCAEVQARPATSSYVTPFGPSAPWNRPVTGLPRHPQSDIYASRLWNYAPSARVGNFNLGFWEYTYPVYYASDATGQYRVSGGNSTINGKMIPWNPVWKAASGSDAQIIVLDPSTGREWDLWQASISGTTVSISNGSLVGSSETDLSSPPGDYRMKSNCWQPSRGIGCQYYAMLVQPEETAAGVIKHALSMPIQNTSRTFYVAPATKLEHSGSEIANAIPEGMRFALNVTDAQIDAWAATKPAAYRAIGKTIARALRDYGWFITDTAGGATWQFEADTSASALWKAQGIDPRSDTLRDLMDGLITQARIYAIVPSNQYPTTEPPSGPTPCTVAESLACETGYNSCMAACSQ